MEAAQVRVFKTLDPSATALGPREHSGVLAVGMTGPLPVPRTTDSVPLVCISVCRWELGQEGVKYQHVSRSKRTSLRDSWK